MQHWSAPATLSHNFIQLLLFSVKMQSYPECCVLWSGIHDYKNNEHGYRGPDLLFVGAAVPPPAVYSLVPLAMCHIDHTLIFVGYLTK